MSANERKVNARNKRQRDRLVLAMMQQPSLEKAAASIGISRATAWRIRQTPEFEEAYQQARREAVAHSYERLQQGSGAAATTMMKIMLDPTNPAASRVRAADRVMQHAKSHLETEDFDRRLRRLEQVMAETRDANPEPSR